jgi:hypothetical protein
MLDELLGHVPPSLATTKTSRLTSTMPRREEMMPMPPLMPPKRATLKPPPPVSTSRLLTPPAFKNVPMVEDSDEDVIPMDMDSDEDSQAFRQKYQKKRKGKPNTKTCPRDLTINPFIEFAQAKVAQREPLAESVEEVNKITELPPEDDREAPRAT